MKRRVAEATADSIDRFEGALLSSTGGLSALLGSGRSSTTATVRPRTSRLAPPDDPARVGVMARLRLWLVRGIKDYLDIARAEARSQWRSILSRPTRPSEPGFRQADFTPTETLLCLAAMLVVNHHRYGGRASRPRSVARS